MPDNEYVEDPADEFDYKADWMEMIDNTQPGGGGGISYQSQDAVLVGLVPYNKIRTAAKFFLGHSWADADSPYRLHRDPVPQRHPTWPQMRAYSVGYVGLAPQSESDNPNREPYLVSPFVGPDNQQLYTGSYQKAILTVRFRSFGRMRFLSDADVEAAADEVGVPAYKKEFMRFCRFNLDPSVEELSADGSSQLHFAETNGVPPNEPSVSNPATPFPAPVVELLAKGSLSVTWLNVPHEYVSSDTDILVPDKILACLGHWNSASFLGYKPGKLMLMALKAEEVLFPIATVDEDVPATGWNLTLVFNQFDPPKGVTGSDKHGHRLFPWRTNGKWYWCVRESGADFYAGADLYTVFQNVNDPS